MHYARPIACCLALATMAAMAEAQHHHPSQDADVHEKFHSRWYMPDDPKKSCCNKADCYPTEVKFVDGRTITAASLQHGVAGVALSFSRLTSAMDRPV
jgi:hypothetical protein